MTARECNTLRVCTVELATAIKDDPVAIAQDLYSMGLIPPNIVDKMRMSAIPGQNKASELLSVVNGKVSNTPKRYHDFVNVLKKHSWMSDVVQLLDATYKNGGVKVQTGLDQNDSAPPKTTSDNDTTSELSMITLECLKLKDGRKIRIPVSIGTKYNELGHILLDDKDGTITAGIEHKHLKDAPAINCEILMTWYGGTGKNPVEWDTLLEVLDDIDLSALADDIRNRK